MHVIQGQMLEVSHVFLFFNKGSHCYENIDNYLVKILVKIIECLVKR